MLEVTGLLLNDCIAVKAVWLQPLIVGSKQAVLPAA
jgi:hypothetical protein